MLNSDRMFFAIRWALKHFAISCTVAALAVALVFFLWYTAPWHTVLGVVNIFCLLVAVDIVCGPLLTLILASPKKTTRERWLDLSLVGLIQLLALGYGLWSLFIARPVILAFETDRFVLVTANEVQREQLAQAPEQLQSLSLAGPQMVGTRRAQSGQETLESVDASLKGVSPAMRPGWWVPYADARPQVLARAQPIETLRNARPKQSEAIDKAVLDTGFPATDLKFLPLVSSTRLDWVVLLNSNGDMVGYAPVEGFLAN